MGWFVFWYHGLPEQFENTIIIGGCQVVDDFAHFSQCILFLVLIVNYKYFFWNERGHQIIVTPTKTCHNMSMIVARIITSEILVETMATKYGFVGCLYTHISSFCCWETSMHWMQLPQAKIDHFVSSTTLV